MPGTEATAKNSNREGISQGRPPCDFRKMRECREKIEPFYIAPYDNTLSEDMITIKLD